MTQIAANSLDDFLASVERQAFRMAMVATSSREDALDIVQDAMFGLVKRYGDKPLAQLRPLFYKILQSRIRDWYRRQSIRNRFRSWFSSDDNDPVAEYADPVERNPAELVSGKKTFALLEDALADLPLRQQQTFLLRAWQGMNVKETALAMGCSEGSVKTQYSRAVQRLQKKLDGLWP